MAARVQVLNLIQPRFQALDWAVAVYGSQSSSSLYREVFLTAWRRRPFDCDWFLKAQVNDLSQRLPEVATA